MVNCLPSSLKNPQNLVMHLRTTAQGAQLYSLHNFLPIHIITYVTGSDKIQRFADSIKFEILLYLVSIIMSELKVVLSMSIYV